MAATNKALDIHTLTIIEPERKITQTQMDFHATGLAVSNAIWSLPGYRAIVIRPEQPKKKKKDYYLTVSKNKKGRYHGKVWFSDEPMPVAVTPQSYDTKPEALKAADELANDHRRKWAYIGD